MFEFKVGAIKIQYNSFPCWFISGNLFAKCLVTGSPSIWYCVFPFDVVTSPRIKKFSYSISTSDWFPAAWDIGCKDSSIV